MAHIEKYSKGAIGHLLAHYDRRAEHIGNECVDRTRSHLNYNLAEELQPDRQGDFIKQRCSEVKVQNRKDVNLMCTWVVTVPKDLPEDEHKQFFKATFDFLSARYGKENVISAYVHMDETTPHMHFAFVPVVEDKKKGGLKVSAKERINRNELRLFHYELEQALSSALGHNVAILNEATKNGNKTITQLKTETAMLAQRQAEKQEQIAKTRTQYAEQRIKVADERIEQARMRMIEAERRAKLEENEVVEQQNKWIDVKSQTNELFEQQKKIEQNIATLKEQLKSAERLKKQEIVRMAEELATEKQALTQELLDIKDQISLAEIRLSELNGQILTAEQVKKIDVKKAPFGMALLKYKDVLDLKKTAERVEKADKIISEEWNIVSRAVKKAEKETAEINEELKDKQEKLENYLKAIDELKETFSSLLDTKYLIKEWKEEERKRGLVSRETLLKNAETIRKQYEKSQNNQSQNHSQSQGRRRR